MFQTSLENDDFVKVCVFLEENTYFHDFDVSEMIDFSWFLQPFLGIDFGTYFRSFLEAILAHFSNFLASFFDTFQALIFGWIFDVIFERF